MPASFLSPLKLEYIDGKNWKLDRDFEYYIGRLGSLWSVLVPVGFVTDFASIPPPISWIWPPAAADYGKAAVIHDWLYRGGSICQPGRLGGPYRPSRAECDVIFLEGMKVLGCAAWKRRIIHRAVRAFGWAAYRRLAPQGQTPEHGRTPNTSTTS